MTSVAESIAIEQMRKHPGLLEWFHFGEVGVSSEFIARYLTGQTIRGSFNDPADPDDFKRCEKLLRAVPSLRKEFPRMAEASTRWEFLVENWEAIAASLEEEIPGIFDGGHSSGRAPKTYALMRADRA